MDLRIARPKQVHQNFTLAKTDEPFLAQIDPVIVAALRAAHSGDRYTVAAATLGIPVNTLKTRVHRCRQLVMSFRARAAAEARKAVA